MRPPTTSNLNITVARLEEKVDGIGSKLDMFIKTATSPEIGFVSSGLLAMMKAEADKEHVEIHRRMEQIEREQDERYKSISNRVWALLFAMIGLLGSVLTDGFLRWSGIKP